MTVAKQFEETEIMDGKLLMYRREDGGVWQYRTWIKDARKYVRKSTGSSNFEEAKIIAEKAFYGIQGKIDADLPVISKTFKQIFEIAMLDEQRKVQRNELSEKRFKFFKRMFKLYYEPYFRNHMVSSITTNVIKDYWRYREDFWNLPDEEREQKRRSVRATRVVKIPSGPTMHLEKRVLDLVVNKSIELGFMSEFKKPDTSPLGKNKKKRRPAMSMEQWKKMRDFMRDVYPFKVGVEDRKRRIRLVFYYYSTTLATTGIRISDARNLKWADVYQSINKTGRSTKMVVQGKGKRRIVMANEIVFIILMEWRNHPLNGRTADDDYVFARADGRHIHDQFAIFEAMKGAAEKTKEYSGVSHDEYDDTFTLYSYRHFFATTQIEEFNTSYADLAKNMGTSMMMIQQHYDHVLAPDIANRVNQLPVGMVTLGDFQVEIEPDQTEELNIALFGDTRRRRQRLVDLMSGKISQQEYSDLLRAGND